MANTKLDPAKLLAEFFDSTTAEGEEQSTTVRIDAIAHRNGVSRQAVLHHLRRDPRFEPSLRADVDTDSQGVWRMKRIGETPLVAQLAELARQRREGLAQAEKARTAMAPLLARARKAEPGSPDDLSLGQLEVLTGISRGHIAKLAEDYLAELMVREADEARARRKTK